MTTIRVRSSGLKHHDHSQIRDHTSGMNRDSERITFINGILNSKNSCIESANTLSKIVGSRVYYIHDPSKNIVTDAVVAGREMLDTYESNAVNKLVKVWKHFINNEKVSTIYHYAHSRGSLVTKQALAKMTESEKRRIYVELLGGPARISSKECGGVKDLQNAHDYIPWFNPLKMFSGVTNWLEVTESRAKSVPRSVTEKQHGFSTYQTAISKSE